MRYLRALHIAWSLVRRRVTRRLTRPQTMYNILKHRKKWLNKTKSIYRNRTEITDFVYLKRTSTVLVQSSFDNTQESRVVGSMTVSAGYFTNDTYISYHDRNCLSCVHSMLYLSASPQKKKRNFEMNSDNFLLELC